jgi:predicted Zn finger-like uncharacterized protein
VKFVCDSCNAKYQIGDDKVAGKTLRMKCRRCGHMIQVAATVTESSVSQKPPQDHSAPVAIPAAPSVPEVTNEDGATVVKPSPLFLLEASGLGGGAAQMPRPGPSVAGTSQPFRGGPRIVPPARPSLRSVPPAAPAGAAAAAAPAPGGAPAGQPGTHTRSAPGLYGGFARAVAAKPESHPPVPTEDWYVGVNGVPLGPVRLAVLRDKAAQGQVDGESLVWREGFDEWQPAKTFPGLLAILDEAKQLRASRTSMPVVVPPGAPSAASAPLAPAPEPSIPFNLVQAPREPAPSAQATASPPGDPRASGAAFAAPGVIASLVATPSTQGSAAGGNVVGKFDPFGPTAAPSAAAPAPAPSSAAAGWSAPSAAGSTAGSGFGLTTTSAGGSESSIDSPPKKGIHPAAWAFVAMAAAFGGVAAWAVFLRKPNVVVVPGETTTVTVPVAGANVPIPNSSTAGPTATEVPTVDASGKPVVPGVGGPRTTATSSKSSEQVAPIDPSILGPGPSGPGTSDPGNSGGPLTAGQIQGVVSSNTARVRKKCWDPASSGRAADAPSSVKVTVKISISPSGSVSGASASGGNEKYFPGLVGCVQSVVSAWKFPPAGEPSEAVVPFNFAAQ